MAKEGELFSSFVVKDQRSFKIENFEKIIELMQQPSSGLFLDLQTQESFENLVALFMLKKGELADEDALFEDAPDEFLDPLMGTLMKHPVILPSEAIVDLMTIKKHLMNEQTDPFNRQPLKLEDVKPDKEL